MKKKSEYLNEMEFIKDWCIAVINFVLKTKDATDQTKRIYESLKNGLISNFDSQNKNIQKGIKDRYKIMREEVGYWPDKMRAELDNILYLEFGETTDQKEDISLIIKRGKINNDEEFDIVNNIANEICQINPRSKELEQLNHLLLIYEQSKK